VQFLHCLTNPLPIKPKASIGKHGPRGAMADPSDRLTQTVAWDTAMLQNLWFQPDSPFDCH